MARRRGGGERDRVQTAGRGWEIESLGASRLLVGASFEEDDVVHDPCAPLLGLEEGGLGLAGPSFPRHGHISGRVDSDPGDGSDDHVLTMMLRHSGPSEI